MNASPAVQRLFHCSLLAAFALASCRTHRVGGTLLVHDGAPAMIRVLDTASAGYEVRLWNAGPGTARCAATDERDLFVLQDGWGRRFERDARRAFEVSISTTGQTLVGYEVEAAGNIEVTVRNEPPPDPSSDETERPLSPPTSPSCSPSPRSPPAAVSTRPAR